MTQEEAEQSLIIRRIVVWSKLKSNIKNINDRIYIEKLIHDLYDENEKLKAKKYPRKSTKNKNKTYRKTYIMKDNNTKLYKIGKSYDPKVREKTLQSEKPSIKMVKIFDYNIEKKLHDLYKNFRVRGEYFNLTPIQVNYICTNF